MWDDLAAARIDSVSTWSYCNHEDTSCGHGTSRVTDFDWHLHLSCLTLLHQRAGGGEGFRWNLAGGHNRSPSWSQILDGGPLDHCVGPCGQLQHPGHNGSGSGHFSQGVEDRSIHRAVVVEVDRLGIEPDDGSALAGVEWIDAEELDPGHFRELIRGIGFRSDPFGFSHLLLPPLEVTAATQCC